MEGPPFRVLFLSQRNSARSMIAEALANSIGHGGLAAFSAGVRPSSDIDPVAVELLEHAGVDVPAHPPRHVREFSTHDSVPLDFVITLTAADELALGDTKEGAFAIRLSDAFTEKKGLKIVDADGRTRMVNVWGKRSNWVDYSTDVDGEKVGVAMFDHPSNPHHPTYWHARDYGLFSLNPFGQNAFDPMQPVNITKLERGQKLTFRWSVVIHPGDAETAHIADLYKTYAAK